MHRIGIDVGSTYTKYCVLDENNNIKELFREDTPVFQENYFLKKCESYRKIYGDVTFSSCGYGRRNVSGIRCENELLALARGVYFLTNDSCVVLDIGGQDTKVIQQERGEIKQFFLNEKCAAGSGLFLKNVVNMLGMSLNEIDLRGETEPERKLSSTCAIFAQSEIVELVAQNVTPEEIVKMVIWQILTQSKKVLSKVDPTEILFSGGLSNILGIETFAEKVLEIKCILPDHASYMSAIGSALKEKE